MTAWQEYLREVRGHLEALRAMGITELVLPPPEEMPAAARPLPKPNHSPAFPQVPPAPAHAPSHTPKVVPVPAATVAVADETLAAIQGDLTGCQLCRLCEGRTNIVFGVGNPKARLMFVGEGPGEDEDRIGEPFVGKAGQLLTNIIKAMGLTRDEVYIANVVKCRPPGNRTPFLDEVEKCYPFLRRQIAAVNPEVIVTLGLSASQALLDVTIPISRLRGNFYKYGPTRVMPTYHPAYLLRNPAEKRAVWDDMQKVMAALGLEAPKEK